MVIDGSTNDWLIDRWPPDLPATSSTMTLDNPRLKAQIEAGRWVLERRAGR
jgi:hypothetical protein